MQTTDMLIYVLRDVDHGIADNVRIAAADRLEALEAWKAEAMEVLRAVAEDGELFGRPDKYQIAARRLVEKEDGR